jgi:hypothetical protein
MEAFMKQDRFLISILVGIGVLIVVALTVFFTRQNKQTYVSDSTPEGIAHNYVLALLNKDYPKAYDYLADLTNKPTYDQFRQAFATGQLNPSNAGIKIGTADITGDDASIQVDMINASSDPFSSEYTNNDSAQLVKQNGAWKISSMPTYSLWEYSWYQKP